jgi:hypothetical protein
VGRALVYEFNDTDWVQLGNDLDGSAEDDRFGTSVDINSDGNVIAISGTQKLVSPSESGYVKIYKYIGTEWTHIGSTINGENAGDLFGQSVSINSAGDMVAIGASENTGNTGHVWVLG